MAARLLPAGPDTVAVAQAVLRAGELVAFPTDTVYGLAAELRNERAIELIFEVKERPRHKAIPVLLGGEDQLAEVAELEGELAARLAAAFWPGPLTLILARKAGLPANLGPDDSVGVRVPEHEFALELLQRCGPLAVTSANKSGAASAGTAAEVQRQIGDRIALIVDGGRTPGGQASTVVDCRDGILEILRPGPLSEEALRSVLP